MQSRERMPKRSQYSVFLIFLQKRSATPGKYWRVKNPENQGQAKDEVLLVRETSIIALYPNLSESN